MEKIVVRGGDNRLVGSVTIEGAKNAVLPLLAATILASEGKTVQVPFKGEVIYKVLDILGGIRSTCTYVGASRLKELTKRTTFIRVSEQENQVFTK